MRRFLNVKIKKESFDSLSHHFLQKKNWGTSWEQLASRIGTKKAYISRVENGHTDV